MDKDVAVIIPAHSWPQYLPEALGSIRSQSVAPAVTICVLDKPPDARRYEEILDGYPDIVQIWLSDNQGPSVARNVGIQAASDAGFEWAVFLDEDDLLHPRFLEKMLLSRQICPDRAIHYCDWVKFGKWAGYQRTPEYTFERLLAGPFIMSASLTKVEAWEDVKSHNGHGFDPALCGWEDYMLFLEMGALGYYGARVGLGLVRYRKEERSTSDQAHNRFAGAPDVRDPKLKSTVAHIRDKLHRLYAEDLTYECPN
jgi:glycosyltransferase involved in cell wall biosynthesis